MLNDNVNIEKHIKTYLLNTCNQSIYLLLNYVIRLCPLNPSFYEAQANTCPLKTTAYSYLHTTRFPQ
jgi:hypothetical protein